MRVRVLVRHVLEQGARGLQRLDQRGIGSLEEHAADYGHIRCEVSVREDRVYHWKPVGTACDQVIGAEGRGLMNESGAILGRDVLRADHEMRIGNVYQVKGPLIGSAL